MPKSDHNVWAIQKCYIYIYICIEFFYNSWLIKSLSLWINVFFLFLFFFRENAVILSYLIFWFWSTVIEFTTIKLLLWWFLVISSFSFYHESIIINLKVILTNMLSFHDYNILIIMIISMCNKVNNQKCRYILDVSWRKVR